MFRSGARCRASPKKARIAISTRWRKNISTRTNIPSPSRAKFACCSRLSPPTSAATSSPLCLARKSCSAPPPQAREEKSLASRNLLTLRKAIDGLDHERRGRTLGVGLLIQLGFDHAVLVEDEDDRPRHAI